jgi:hypothetical protein
MVEGTLKGQQGLHRILGAYGTPTHVGRDVFITAIWVPLSRVYAGGGSDKTPYLVDFPHKIFMASWCVTARLVFKNSREDETAAEKHLGNMWLCSSLCCYNSDTCLSTLNLALN